MLGKLLGDGLLLTDRAPLEVVNEGELTGAEVSKVASGEALEELGEVGLELEAGLGVEEVEGHAGAPPADPKEGVLEQAPPRRREHGEHVLLGAPRFGLVVMVIVAEDAVDDGVEGLVVGVPGGGGGGEEVMEVLALLDKPALEELVEALELGREAAIPPGGVSGGGCCSRHWRGIASVGTEGDAL